MQKTGNQVQKGSLFSIEDEGEIKVIRTKKNQIQNEECDPCMWCGTPPAGNSGEKKNSAEWECPTARPVTVLFFQGGTVAVVDGGNVAVEDAIPSFQNLQKSLSCSQKRRTSGGQRCFRTGCFRCPNVEMVWDSVPVLSKERKKVESYKSPQCQNR